LRCILVEGSEISALGLKSHNAAGKSVTEFFGPEKGAIFEPLLKEGLSGTLVSKEIQIDNKFYYVHIIPIKNDKDQIVNVMDLIQNITGRKQAEEQIRSALAEKEVLLREIHHRVKNNLAALISLIELQAESILNPETLQFFKELRARVRTMALVHENLYQTENLARVNFGAYLDNLMVDLFHLFGAIQAVDLVTDFADVYLNIDTAIPCGLIVNEIITNALKYAFPEGKPCIERGESDCKIRVILRREANNRFTLLISDNGVGLPPNPDWRNTQTLGFQLVQILSRQLRAEIELDTRNGTAFQIRFTELKSPDFGKSEIKQKEMSNGK
jgi:two-component sensor histidine kinase